MQERGGGKGEGTVQDALPLSLQDLQTQYNSQQSFHNPVQMLQFKPWSCRLCPFRLEDWLKFSFISSIIQCQC